MPDPATIDVSVLASSLASTLKTIHNYLYDIQDAADPVKSIIASTHTLLLGLREKLNAETLTVEEDEQTSNDINTLERFYHSARRLNKVSDDIAINQSVQDRFILGTQWDQCCRDLLALVRPVSKDLVSLSDMARDWPPVALPTADQLREGETNTGADTRIRDGTSSKKEAS